MNAPEPPGLGSVRFHWSGVCAVPPQSVYAALADLRNALVWTGREMPETFRVVSLDAPAGEAGVGTEWTSTGADRTGRFEDSSIVVIAEPPYRFVFRTAAVYAWKGGRRSTAELKHIWEIAAEGRGSRVTYDVLSTGLRPWQAPWNVAMATPGMRQLMIAMIKRTAGRAFTNFLRFAESRDQPAAQRVA